MVMIRNNINYVGEIGEFIIFPEASIKKISHQWVNFFTCIEKALRLLWAARQFKKFKENRFRSQNWSLKIRDLGMRDFCHSNRRRLTLTWASKALGNTLFAFYPKICLYSEKVKNFRTLGNFWSEWLYVKLTKICFKTLCYKYVTACSDRVNVWFSVSSRKMLLKIVWDLCFTVAQVTFVKKSERRLKWRILWIFPWLALVGWVSFNSRCDWPRVWRDFIRRHPIGQKIYFDFLMPCLMELYSGFIMS